MLGGGMLDGGISDGAYWERRLVFVSGQDD